MSRMPKLVTVFFEHEEEVVFEQLDEIGDSAFTQSHCTLDNDEDWSTDPWEGTSLDLEVGQEDVDPEDDE